MVLRCWRERSRLWELLCAHVIICVSARYTSVWRYLSEILRYTYIKTINTATSSDHKTTYLPPCLSWSRLSHTSYTQTLSTSRPHTVTLQKRLTTVFSFSLRIMLSKCQWLVSAHTPTPTPLPLCNPESQSTGVKAVRECMENSSIKQ